MADASAVPAVVSVSLTSSTLEYLQRLLELGAMEGGALDRNQIAAELNPLINGAHHVLAGGEVSVQITTQGNAGTVAELQQKFDKAMADADAVAKSGNYVLALQP